MQAKDAQFKALTSTSTKGAGYHALVRLCQLIKDLDVLSSEQTLPALNEATKKVLKRLHTHKGIGFEQLIDTLYKPLCLSIDTAYTRHQQKHGAKDQTKLHPSKLHHSKMSASSVYSEGFPLIVGISGGQGTGKSTLSTLLQYLLQQGLGYRVLVLSLDDFYLKKRERIRLAKTIHPLFATRGVPGTHDISLLATILDRAMKERSGFLKHPIFAKDRDDRLSHTRKISLPVQIILFEGWCVGAQAEPEPALAQPLNALERTEDTAGNWRLAVNTHLKQAYARIFNRIDYLVYLRVADFKTIFTYRLEQEQMLPSDKQMTPTQLRRFIEHYERITRHALAEMGTRADVVVQYAGTREQVTVQFQTPYLEQ